MRFIYRLHAVDRMFERGLGREEVEHVVATGETIEEHADPRPYPSRLVLGWVRDEPLHVVASTSPDGAETYVVTVYRPDPAKWEPDWETRRRKP